MLISTVSWDLKWMKMLLPNLIQCKDAPKVQKSSEMVPPIKKKKKATFALCLWIRRYENDLFSTTATSHTKIFFFFFSETTNIYSYNWIKRLLNYVLTFKTSQYATLLFVSLVNMCLLSLRMWHWIILAPPIKQTRIKVTTVIVSLFNFTLNCITQHDCSSVSLFYISSTNV